jgi:predicted metal-dependent peptidase
MKPVPDHHQALSRAKIQLMSRPDSAFFTTVCFSLKHIWDDTCGTAYTDGKVIGFNTKFFMSLSPEEQLFLLLHETLHVAFLHIMPLPAGWNHDRANIAMDHVINLILIEAGYKMPSMGYADPQYKGMCWQDVYKLLPENTPPPPMRDVRPSSGDPAETATLTREIEDILVRAATQSKISGDAPGSIPGDIQIYLNGLLNPKLPWHRLLQKYLQQFIKNDYSWKKFNRRFFPKNYMPGMFGECLINMAVAVDISGSVSDSDFHAFVTEIASIMRMMKPEKITLLLFDTRVISETVIKNLKDLMEVKFSGRGGTAIGPVIDWANENKPQLLMVFSDGEFRFHGPQAKNETLWVIHNNQRFTAPFGKVIHYTI